VNGDIEKARVCVKIDITLPLLLRMLQQAHLECRIKVKISITNRWQASISTPLPLPLPLVTLIRLSLYSLQSNPCVTECRIKVKTITNKRQPGTSTPYLEPWQVWLAA